MAVQDEEKYQRWKAAVQELELRQKFYNAVVSKYPPDHFLVKDVRAKLVAAQEAYDKVVSEL